jgi:hypothetical protein
VINMKICNKCNKEFDEINDFSVVLTLGDEKFIFCSLDCFKTYVEEMIKPLPTCKTQKCKYQASIPGDCHITCKHPIVENNSTALFSDIFRILGNRGGPRCALDSISKQMGIFGNKTGIKNGWFNWPFNFDPIWLERCAKFEAVEK